MMHTIEKQLPYSIPTILLSWIYLYFYYANNYIWLSALLVVPIIIGSFLFYKMFAVPESEFNIVNVLKNKAPIIVSCILCGLLNCYILHKTIDIMYMAFLCCFTILIIILLERSIYD